MLNPIRNNHFARQSFGAYVVQISAVGITYGLNVALARWLGVEQYGVYVTAYNTVLLLAVLGGMGFRFSSLKFIALYVEQQAWSNYKGFIRLGSLAISGTTLMFTGLASLFIWQLYAPSVNRDRLLIGVWAVPLYALFEFYADVVRSAGNVLVALIFSRVLRPLLILILSAILLQIGSASALLPLLALHISTTTILLGLMWLLSGKLKHPIQTVRTTYMPRIWLTLSGYLLLVQGVAMTQDRVPVLAVSLLLSEVNAGLYSVAFRLATLLTLSLDAAGLVFAARIAPLHATGQIKAIENLMLWIIRWSLLIAVPLGAGMLFFSNLLLGLFGDVFRQGQPILQIAISGQIIRAFFGPAGYVLNLTGYERDSVQVGIIVIIATLILVPICTVLAGTTGTAFAVLLSQLLQGGLFYHRMRQRLKIHPLPRLIAGNLG